MKRTFYIFFMRVNFRIRQVMRQKRVANLHLKSNTLAFGLSLLGYRFSYYKLPAKEDVFST
jgi:hypothetical protein